MNKKIIVIIFVGTALLIGGLSILAQPDNNNSQPSLKSSSNSDSSPETFKADIMKYDFGKISMARGNVSYIYKVKNTGIDPLIIEKVYTSCMCTNAFLKIADVSYGPFGMPGHGAVPSINVNLDAGQEAEMEVIFDPAAHGPAGVGGIERVVTLENSAGAPLNLEFSAFVTP